MKKAVFLTMVLVVTLGVAGTAFAASQTWDLDNEGNSTEVSPWVMDEVELGDPIGGTAGIAQPGSTMYFRSHNASNADTNFSAARWQLSMNWDGLPIPDSNDLQIDVGTWVGGRYTI